MSEKVSDLWFYYLKSIKVKIGPLKLDTMCSQLVNKNIKLEEIFLAQSGWPKWKIALDVPIFVTVFNDLLENEKNSLPPIEGECLSPPPSLLPQNQDNHKWTESRKHPRVTMELKAIFVVEKKSFRTKTINLSLGGIKITDSLPAIYFDREIQVFLSSSDLKFSIKFTAELAGNKSSGNQIQFTNQNDLGIKHLEAWLLNMEQKQNLLIKKTA